jgi:hypothetical protein
VIAFVSFTTARTLPARAAEVAALKGLCNLNVSAWCRRRNQVSGRIGDGFRGGLWRSDLRFARLCQRRRSTDLYATLRAPGIRGHWNTGWNTCFISYFTILAAISEARHSPYGASQSCGMRRKPKTVDHQPGEYAGNTGNMGTLALISYLTILGAISEGPAWPREAGKAIGN